MRFIIPFTQSAFSFINPSRVAVRASVREETKAARTEETSGIQSLIPPARQSLKSNPPRRPKNSESYYGTGDMLDDYTYRRQLVPSTRNELEVMMMMRDRLY